MRWFIPEVGPSSVRREGTQKPSRPAYLCVLCGLPVEDNSEILCTDCLEHELESEVHQ